MRLYVGVRREERPQPPEGRPVRARAADGHGGDIPRASRGVAAWTGGTDRDLERTRAHARLARVPPRTCRRAPAAGIGLGVSATSSITTAGTRWQMTSPAPRGAWDDVLAADPFALVTQSPEWLAGHCALGGYEDASLLFERADGRRVVLPMARRSRVGDGR